MLVSRQGGCVRNVVGFAATFDVIFRDEKHSAERSYQSVHATSPAGNGMYTVEMTSSRDLQC